MTPAGGNLLTDAGWKPRQAWMKQGEQWDRFEMDGKSGIRLKKTPVLLEQRVATTGTISGIRISTQVRLTDLKPKDRWGVPVLTVRCLDAGGKSVGKQTQRFFRDSGDWVAFSQDLEVPPEASSIVAILESRAESGVAEFADLRMEVLSAREAPEGGSAVKPDPAAAAKVDAKLDTPVLLEEPLPQPARTESTLAPIGGRIFPPRIHFDPSIVTGAVIDESVIQQTLVVSQGKGASDNNAGTKESPLATIASAFEKAGKLLHDGVPTRIVIMPGVYKVHDLTMDVSQIGGQSQKTLLVVEGAEPGRVILTGYNPETSTPEGWELVDAERRVYRRDFRSQEFVNPKTPSGYRPMVAQISRRQELVKINDQVLDPVMLEEWVYVRTAKANWEGGFKSADPGYYKFAGYRGWESLAPGTFGIAEMRPGDENYVEHPHPGSLFIRLPESLESLKGAEVRVLDSWSQGMTFEGSKHNLVVRNLIFELFQGRGLRFAGKGIPGTGSGMFTASSYARNILVENVESRWNQMAGLNLQKVAQLTLRNVKVDHNGKLGVYMVTLDNVLVEDTSFSYNNRRGAYSGVAEHGAGGVDFIGRNMIFRRLKVNGNYGFGFRTDHQANNLLFEDCQFNENLGGNGGGAFLELAPGPIVMRGCQFIGNGGRGLRVMNQNDLTVENTVMANNADAQLELSAVVHGGPHRMRYTRIWNDDSSFTEGMWLPGIERFSMSNSIISTVHEKGGRQDISPLVQLTHMGWQPGVERTTEFLKGNYSGKGNQFWAPTVKTFYLPDAGRSEAPYEKVTDLAEWRAFTGQDLDSQWRQTPLDIPTRGPSAKNRPIIWQVDEAKLKEFNGDIHALLMQLRKDADAEIEDLEADL